MISLRMLLDRSWRCVLMVDGFEHFVESPEFGIRRSYLYVTHRRFNSFFLFDSVPATMATGLKSFI